MLALGTVAPETVKPCKFRVEGLGTPSYVVKIIPLLSGVRYTRVSNLQGAQNRVLTNF